MPCTEAFCVFFAGAKAEIAGFIATGLPCGLPCDDVLARFYVVFASQSYVSGVFAWILCFWALSGCAVWASWHASAFWSLLRTVRVVFGGAFLIG